MEKDKGRTWNEKLTFKKSLSSERDNIPANNDSSILLDFTVKSGTLNYTFTQNRSQASSRGEELENISDYYVGWFLNFCGQERNITAYEPSIDGDDVVIGIFTLDSAFTTEPITGENMFLLNPANISDQEQQLIVVDSENQIFLGGNNNVAVSSNSTKDEEYDNSSFSHYEIIDEDNIGYADGYKPSKTGSIYSSSICASFSTIGERANAYITNIGIYLDSVPAGTKARVFLIGRDKLNARYPLIENVTIDDFNRGNGDPVSVSTYSDPTTWNQLNVLNPNIARPEINFDFSISFSDSNGDPVFLNIPVDTSITDFPSFRNVRANNIQSASGTSITLDTNASPRDDDYNGMRLYIGSEYKIITDYDGTTKIATIESSFTTPPSPSDAYKIRISFVRPLLAYTYKTIKKGQVQNKHNYNNLSYSNDGEFINIGTVNYVDTTSGETTLKIPVQSSVYVGAWFMIIDKEGTFSTNNLIIDINEFDYFEGAETDYICDEKYARYIFWYVDDDYGWTVEKYQAPAYGEMYQYDQSNTISIAAKDTWYDVDNMSEGNTKNVTFQNGKELVCQIPGDYDVSAHVCATDGANTSFKWRIAVNGTAIGKTQGCSRVANATDVMNPPVGGILTLAKDDIVKLQVMNITNTSDVDIIDTNIRMQLIRDL